MSPCSYAEYIMQNAGLDKSQAGIKTARKNINSLRNADDTTLMVESEEELKNLLIKVKGVSEKPGLQTNIQQTKIVASSPINSWQIEGEKVEMWQILVSWAPESQQLVTVAMKLKDSCFLEEKLWLP